MIPGSYRTLMLLAISSSHIALYQVSVRWVRCLPLTSFRFQLAMDTLVSLAGRFPLPGLVRDLHPLDDTHAGQTKKRGCVYFDTPSTEIKLLWINNFFLPLERLNELGFHSCRKPTGIVPPAGCGSV